MRDGIELESRYRVGSLESGTLLCQAYEAYLELHAPATISFEHAWFLLLALSRHDELGVRAAPYAAAVRLRDLLVKRRLTCGNCEAALQIVADPDPAILASRQMAPDVT